MKKYKAYKFRIYPEIEDRIIINFLENYNLSDMKKD